jgi:calcineurin-like phosphoesterase family protein
MKTYFTADTHFSHQNIIKYANRPFKNLIEMDETLVRNWNERVKPEDTVIFLGDFCFRNTAGGKIGEGTMSRAEHHKSRLNGNIVFVRGNHDNNNSLNTKITALELELGGHLIYCVHSPVDFDSQYSINLCGHVHDHWQIKKWGSTYLVNVGVDVWKYMPVSIDEIMRRLTKFMQAERAELKKELV